MYFLLFYNLAVTAFPKELCEEVKTNEVLFKDWTQRLGVKKQETKGWFLQALFLDVNILSLSVPRIEIML